MTDHMKPASVGVLSLVLLLTAQVAPAADDAKAESQKKPAASPSKAIPEKSADGLTPLNKQGTVLLDKNGKRVLLKTKVVLREGYLEMFCCLAQTKEHESILALDGKAYVVHTGLMAIGAEPGKPVEFDPKYKAPTGQRVDIFIQWKDDKGTPQRVPARTWVRHALHRFYVEKLEKLPADLNIPKEDDDLTLKYIPKFQEISWYGPMSVRQKDKLLKMSTDEGYKKIIQKFFDQTRPREMEADWIFAGSNLAKNTQTGEEYYEAEGGDLICVANFPSAMIDVSVQSSASQEQGLSFEPYTERIPPVGTEVTVELIPSFDKKENGKKEKR